MQFGVFLFLCFAIFDYLCPQVNTKRLKKMKKIILIIACCCMACMLMAQQRLLGGDISLLPSYDEADVVYADSNGHRVEPMRFLRAQGWNAMRVRLFVNPANASAEHRDEGVCQDLMYVMGLSRQIKELGLKLMLDFHYSDTWADPGKQYMPKGWPADDTLALARMVYAHTCSSLLALKAAGAEPDLIQVGNEITNGMLWPVGKIDPTKDDNWDVLSLFLKEGCRACREVCPNARIIIHTEKAGDWDVTESYYRHLRQYEVDYDIIGLSYYPMWHKSIPNLGVTLRNLARDFSDKEVMIVETAAYYSHERDPWAQPDQYSEFYPITVEGQRQFTRELVDELLKHPNVTGLFWWFPEENGYQNSVTKGWLNRGLFDNRTGRALPALREFGRFR
jgi:arabinogalactan endo-1,4-beta-galactosidase